MAAELPAVNPQDLRPPGAVPAVFAHRGMSSRAPENTLAAFRLVTELGIPGVELDIHQCGSGELVVAHDRTLKRTAGIDLDLTASDLKTIRDHDIGSWFAPEFADERVPLLEEVTDLLGTAVVYDIEIKSPVSRHEGSVSLEESLATFISRGGITDCCLVSSFDPFIIRRFESIAPGVPTALIYSNGPEMPVAGRRARGLLFCRPELIKPHHSSVSRSYVRRHHRRGRLVVPWTVDDPETALRLAAMGVDGIVSNCPEVILGRLQTEAN